MSAPPIAVPPITTLAAAQHVMEQHQVVVDGDRVVGIVTWSDLRAASPLAMTTLSPSEWQMLEQATVVECMTRNPITIMPDAPLRMAAQLPLTHRIARLPVVADRHLVGVITTSDLLRLLLVKVSSTPFNAGPSEY